MEKQELHTKVSPGQPADAGRSQDPQPHGSQHLCELHTSRADVPKGHDGLCGLPLEGYKVLPDC